MASLANQFIHAIDTHFRPSASKHNYQGENRLVFSYGERETLIKASYNFVNTIKATNPEISKIYQIKPEHTKAYLDTKSKIWSDASIKSQFSALLKICDLSKQTYKKADIGFMNGVERPFKARSAEEKVAYRTIWMERKDFDKIIEASKKGYRNPDTPSTAAIRMAGALGMRVTEISTLKVKDINLKENSVHCIGKGGRHRTYTNISPERMAVIRDIYNTQCHGKGSGDYVFTGRSGKRLDADSINKQLGRLADTIKDGKGTLANKYQANKTGIHSIRKMYATERYLELISEGMDYKKAGGQVMDELGHGRQRQELCRVYIKGYGCVLITVTK